METSHATMPGIASPPQSGNERPARLGGLDGLRAVAVAAVVAYHFFPDLLPGGFVGVDVFFVISGFLITGLLVAEHGRSGRVSLAAFWRRRARRLVPPLVPLVLVSATIAWLIGGDVLVGLGWQVFGASTFGYNWVSIANNTSYFAAGSPELFRNLWSLAVEEQFYLVWPLLLLALLLIRSRRARLALVGLLAAASAVLMGVLYQPGADPTRVYYGSDTHSFGLFAGAALALLLRRQAGEPGEFPRARPWLGIAALAGLLAAIAWLHADAGVAYRGGLAGVSLLTAVAIWAGVRGGRFGRRLDSAPLRYLGERSYGIYLWHWPVLVLVQAAWPSGERAGQAAAPIGALAAALTLVAAGISYRWLEQPIRRLGLRGSIRWVASLAARSPGRRQAVLASAVVALLLAGGTTAALVTAPAASSAQSEIERGQKALDAAARAGRTAAKPEATAPTPGGDMITAVGDSVMLASAPELQAAFPGIAIDAKVSRGMLSAPEILSSLARAGTLRPVVVVGLGTNGPIAHADLASIQRVIGPDRDLIMVNAFADRDWTQGVNDSLADFSARNRLVELANWHDAIAPHADVLAGDRIHPGPAGGRIYAACVGTALQRLADLPPLRVPGANRLLPFPV
ncbi:MAG TPA: acyltransferase family protein [Cryobacterium sp.]|nr:acyltransferase family protein [Cryobacterium sp.]